MSATPTMRTPLGDALAIAGRGIAVFPARNKKPLVKWKDEATSELLKVYGWWERWPDAQIGVPMPPATVAIDIDDYEAVKQANLSWVPTAGQQTPSGGFHFFYKTDGRPAAQTVKRGGIALDTRVGGLGYVIAYDPEPFDTARWASAPEWVYEETSSTTSPEQLHRTGPMGTRDDIIEWLGGLAARNPNMTQTGFLDLLQAAVDAGNIIALDPARPWHKRDLVKLASEAAAWAGKDPDWWAERGITRENQDQYQQFIDRIIAKLLVLSATAKEVANGLRLTSAADILARRVHWLLDGRLALGSMSLLGGREGQGKTLYSNELAAHVTRGTLQGELAGTARNVIIVTTEDSWAHTIVPRLMAAGADRSRIFRAEAMQAGVATGLSLPNDMAALEQAIVQTGAALVVIDPLMSRLDGKLDSHKDADVRRALEPLVTLGDRTGVHIIGIIHVNKTATTDPLTSLMGSRAFAAVARAVLFVMRDPEDGNVRLIGQPKNNLGRVDLPTMRFSVEEVVVGKDPDDNKPITAPRMVWLDSTERTIEDALTALTAPHKQTKASAAAEWLVRYLRECPDYKAESSAVVAAAKGTEHEEWALRNAREKLDVDVIKEGFPAKVYWQLPIKNWGPAD